MSQRRASTGTASTERSADYALLAARTSGIRFWLPAVAVLIGAVLLVPVVWVLLAHWGGVPLGTGNTTSDLLATIGGVMGATFTVGGLIIALVSVYTQLSIENRIRRSFEMLLPELDERARAQIEAYIAFTRATEENDWRRAQELAREALEKWPALPEVRRFLARKMSRDIAQWFFLREVKHTQPATFAPNSYATDAGDFALHGVITSIYGTSMTTQDPVLYLSREDLPSIEAVTWLKDAIAHGEDMDGDLWALLALVYGTERRYDDMMNSLKKSLECNEELKPDFQAPTQLALLVYACAPSDLSARLKALGEVIGRPLPAARAAVLASLRAVDMSAGTYNWNVLWIAFEKPVPANPGQEPLLGMLHIQLGGSTDARTGVARWMLGRQGHTEVIPSNQTPIDIERLVNELDAKFVFICQHDFGWPLQA